jgi:Flp pilus assembly protein CpaB
MSPSSRTNGASHASARHSALLDEHVPSVAPIGLTPARARAQLQRRVNVRVLGALLVMLVTALLFLGIEVWTAPATRGVLVASHDLPAGSRLRRGDVLEAQVQLPEAQAQAAIAASELDNLPGRQVLTDVFGDQVLVWRQLAAADQPVLEPGYVTVTLAVTPATAVSGAVDTGDWVRVVATTNKGRPDSTTTTLLDAAQVLSVGRGDAAVSGLVDTQSDVPAPRSARLARPISTITLAIPPAMLERVTNTKWNADLDISLIGAPPTTQP